MSSTDLTPEDVAYDEGPGSILAMSLTLGITTAIVVLRFGIRILRKIRFGLEDWSMAAALILSWALYALAVYAILYGAFGRNERVLYSMDPNYGRGQTRKTGQLMVWVGQLIYISLITAIKLSVLSMYHRVFPTRFMKWGGGILGTIAIMWFISTLLVVIFQCDPVSLSWGVGRGGICRDNRLILLGISIPNIFTDIAILCLPMYQVYHLQVSRAKKIGLCLVFLLGSLVVAASIYRFKVLVDVYPDTPQSLGYTVYMNKVNIWTIFENSVGMVSASIPTLGPLFSQLGRLCSCLRAKQCPKRDTRRADLALVTIGGSGPPGLSRKFLRGNRNDRETLTTERMFERLPDVESDTYREYGLMQSGPMTHQSD